MLKDIKGIGPKKVELLNKLKIYNQDDLVNHLPFRYDVIKETPLEEGDIIINAQVVSNPRIIFFRKLNKLDFNIKYHESILKVIIL